VVLLLSLAYVLIGLVISVLQRRLIYVPWTESSAALHAAAPSRGVEPWFVPGEDTPIGWRSPASIPQAGAPVLIFHGNAGHALHRSTMIRRFRSVPGVGSVAVLEYPGYGARAGTPSQASVTDAALRAVDDWYATTGAPVVIAGESLGSVVAAHAAAARPAQVRGLLLITPMNKLEDVAHHHFPWLPIRWILRENWDAERALRHLNLPLALVLAERDEVIPTHLGKRLAQQHPDKSKVWVVNGAGHNDLSYEPGSAVWDAALLHLFDH
jgi:pimeloyl-ACP methyl ester carboxylesterase